MSFGIKRNDRAPSLEVTLGGIDLTGTTATFIMKLQGAATPKVSAPATVIAATSSLRYDWGATDTDTIGMYQAEFEVTFAGGIKRTFPGNDYLYVLILPDLG